MLTWLYDHPPRHPFLWGLLTGSTVSSGLAILLWHPHLTTYIQFLVSGWLWVAYAAYRLGEEQP